MKRDDPDVYTVEAQPLPDTAQHIIEVLAPMVTPARMKRIEDVIARRTMQIAVVLDDVTDPHNVSAVMRSAEAFGVQNIYWVQGTTGLRAARVVSKRTDQWLTIHKCQDVKQAVEKLKAQNFSIWVASMEGSATPQSLQERLRTASQSVAVVFGNEHRGVRPELRALADGTFQIPMVGFVESLNISVAAAVTLSYLTQATHDTPINVGQAQVLKAQILNAFSA